MDVFALLNSIYIACWWANTVSALTDKQAYMRSWTCRGGDVCLTSLDSSAQMQCRALI
jgi:hypothetical protein